ncbi:E3 SUMO-protein ligase PIAS1 [Orchesella cincta]|uniref:E3 SUMO-protein ligase PIAS1 n=1 Tax=Orchesella cincta TaxID=48709 RepID=A0A1D2MI32_ORCCI|nr:E3 SUMO-protein ligase PIAS1 [Orchesella cincta]
MAPMIAKLKKMVEGFAKPELKALLRSVPKTNAAVKRITGLRRDEMKEKCFELIENGDILSKTVFELYKKRTEQLVLKQFKIGTPHATVEQTLTTESTAVVAEDDKECQEVPIDLSLSLSPLPSCSSADVVASKLDCSVISAGDQIENNFFVGSPFYELRAVISEFTPLQSLMTFTLTPEHAAEFTQAGFEIQVRFCKLNSSGSFNGEDAYPPKLKLKVNGCVVPIVQLYDEMIDLTATPVTLCHINSFRPNRLDVSWNARRGDGIWVISMYLVKMLTTEDLLERMRCKGVRLEKATIGMIKNKIGKKASDSMYIVSVRCPIGKARMSLACRALSCTHVRCFDARTFLESQEKHPFSPLRCPLCCKRVDFDDLRIDEYFQGILEELSPKDGNKIKIHFDGTWLPDN